MRSDEGTFRLSNRELLEKHAVRDGSGCWLWKASVNTWGYGRVGANRTERLAHRISYLVFKGEIPDGMLVLHRCDFPRCINPDHLFLGTNADNVKDMVAKGRNVSLSGERNVNAKLTFAAVSRIRSSNKTITELAREHGVSRRAIAFVREEKTWVRN